MIYKIRSRKGQSLIEYAVLLIVVMAVFLSTGNYFKRGLQGRWRSAVDDLGEQYDPRVANSRIRHTLVSNTATDIMTIPVGGGNQMYTSRTDKSNMTQSKSGYMSVESY